jgi:serine-type D-Ala-D-Ala carboxypeptidase/endopeptidase
VAAGHLAPLVSQGDVPSLAYAVVREGVVELGGFGGADPQTIFEIGSVTKVFTALLLADMAERGQVRLDDLAAGYLPGGGTGPVRLADLATHTSGLPRLPPGLRWSALASPKDPYARYPAARFERAARRSLGHATVPNPYAYSNYGYGVLGYLLGQAAGSPYEVLVMERICGPLGLADTTFDVPAAARIRKAQGHARGRAVPDWHLGSLAAAGGLHSTAADMAALLRACLAPAATPLDGAIRAAVQPRVAIPSGQIGLAWHHARRPGSTIIWHNGMTGGFSAMIAFDPGLGYGMAVLANSAALRGSPLDPAVFEALRE